MRGFFFPEPLAVSASSVFLRLEEMARASRLGAGTDSDLTMERGRRRRDESSEKSKRGHAKIAGHCYIFLHLAFIYANKILRLPSERRTVPDIRYPISSRSALVISTATCLSAPPFLAYSVPAYSSLLLSLSSSPCRLASSPQTLHGGV